VAVNIPAYDTQNFSFGPGVLFLAGMTVNSPELFSDDELVDVGGVRSGSTFAVTRTRLEVNQGSPITLTTQFVTQESAILTVNGIEWKLSQIDKALGAGVVVGTDAAGSTTTLGFGGDLNVKEVGVKFQHVMPSGATLTLRLWRAQGQGEITLTFGDDIHEIPYSFATLQANDTWQDVDGVTNSATLGTSEQLFKMTLVRP
jgi:hypothetical protein